MNYNELLKKISDYVDLFFIEHNDPRLFYHNQFHTKEMFEATQKIASHYQLNDHDFFVVSAAALFHDIGYLLADPPVHEEKSADLASDFLKKLEVPDADIEEIRKCILATKMPQRPNTLLEKIVCDADLYHLGTDMFKLKSKLLRKEAEALNQGTKIEGEEWRNNTISVLDGHQYHTDYCRLRLEKTKNEHLDKLKRKQQEKILAGETVVPQAKISLHEFLDKAIAQPEPCQTTEGVKKPQNNGTPASGNAANTPRPKTSRPIRGVETMFRVSSSNHQRLSVMADNKAHIMISVNSIIVSAALVLVVKNLDSNKFLIVPTLILLGVNVITIIYAVLATRPRIPNGVFTKEQVEKKSVNLLFFGSFYKMSFKEYEYGMIKMMNDSEFLYGSLIKDIYWQGRVLGRKYRLLHHSYNVFMYGIAIAVIAFAISGIFR